MLPRDVWFLLSVYVAILPISPSSGAVCTPNLSSTAVCALPDCACASRQPPPGIQVKDIPQIVTITFDDAVNDANIEYYRLLFYRERTNPNGCPQVATFFVSDDDDRTDYAQIRELYLGGHEIGSHSITHREPSSWWAQASYSDWKDEIKGMRDRLAQMARIPPREVRGMRAPYLELGADRQFNMMRDYGFTYDSSFMTGPYQENDKRLPSWPYTLDFPPSLEFCDSWACPKQNFSGIWELPLNRWIGLDGHSCPMSDACNQNGLWTKADTLRYLWKNFNRHYNNGKAPLGLHMHATWFKDKHKLEAMDEFLDVLSSMDDVYVTTLWQLIQWMKDVTALDALPSFAPWRTSCNKGRVLLSRATTGKPTISDNEKPPTRRPRKKKIVRQRTTTPQYDEEEYYADDYEEERPQKVLKGGRSASEGARKSRRPSKPSVDDYEEPEQPSYDDDNSRRPQHERKSDRAKDHKEDRPDNEDEDIKENVKSPEKRKNNDKRVQKKHKDEQNYIEPTKAVEIRINKKKKVSRKNPDKTDDLVGIPRDEVDVLPKEEKSKKHEKSSDSSKKSVVNKDDANKAASGSGLDDSRSRTIQRATIHRRRTSGTEHMKPCSLTMIITTVSLLTLKHMY